MSSAQTEDDRAGAQSAGTEGRSSSAVVRGFRSTVGRESAAFGFSILVTVMFGVLQSRHGSPETLDLFLYAAGAVASFTLLEAVMSRAFTTALPTHRTEVMAVGTAMNILSVVAGVGVALGLAELIKTDAAWLLAPCAGGLVYLVLESLEITLAERIKWAAGDPKADQVSP